MTKKIDVFIGAPYLLPDLFEIAQEKSRERLWGRQKFSRNLGRFLNYRNPQKRNDLETNEALSSIKDGHTIIDGEYFTETQDGIFDEKGLLMKSAFKADNCRHLFRGVETSFHLFITSPAEYAAYIPSDILNVPLLSEGPSWLPFVNEWAAACTSETMNLFVYNIEGSNTKPIETFYSNVFKISPDSTASLVKVFSARSKLINFSRIESAIGAAQLERMDITYSYDILMLKEMYNIHFIS